MKQKQKTRGMVVGLFAALILSQVSLGAEQPETRLAALATNAVSADLSIAGPAIKELRAAGPAGLDALIAANAQAIAVHANTSAGPTSDASWPRITAALDAVSAQQNDYASGLYWYTDLASAQAAARATGKPVLSLRLLGNLSDEYSCANSRFFSHGVVCQQRSVQTTPGKIYSALAIGSTRADYHN